MVRERLRFVGTAEVSHGRKAPLYARVDSWRIRPSARGIVVADASGAYAFSVVRNGV